ncbi:MAG: hypothetical protein HRT94_02145 [Alphaproteobacteria bacterium]|nr:hypothetical protein [Alphaproteobacteria bacterium]
MRFALLALLLLLPISVHAEEADPIGAILEEFKEENKEEPEDTSVRFAPDFCDFEITFPEEPYISRRCPEGANGKCYKLTSYTMVYDLKTTVEVSVTCVPSNEQKFARYNEPIMRAALNGMVKRAGVENFEIGFMEQETHKQASLSGTGGIGSQNKIYTAQLWSGPNSVFTLEASLTGRSQHEADSTFSEILKTVHLKKEEEPEDETTD